MFYTARHSALRAVGDVVVALRFSPDSQCPFIAATPRNFSSSSAAPTSGDAAGETLRCGLKGTCEDGRVDARGAGASRAGKRLMKADVDASSSPFPFDRRRPAEAAEPVREWNEGARGPDGLVELDRICSSASVESVS